MAPFLQSLMNTAPTLLGLAGANGGPSGAPSNQSSTASGGGGFLSTLRAVGGHLLNFARSVNPLLDLGLNLVSTLRQAAAGVATRSLQGALESRGPNAIW